MRILARYIFKTICSATFLVLLIITSVLFIMLLLGELKNVGSGDYGIVSAVLYVLMMLPNELYQFSPMMILLGCLIGLSILSSSRELAVMRSSGYSTRRIMLSATYAGIFLILVMSFLGEWIGPVLNYKAEIHKTNDQNAGEAVVTAAGVWFHVGNNFIRVERVVSKQLLENVTRYQFDESHHLLSATFAKRLVYQKGVWQLQDGYSTSFFQDRTHSQAFATAPWDIKFNPNLLHIGLIDPREMSLPKLAKFSEYLRQNGLQSTEYKFDFWQRIFQPLASLVMVFLALPFVLGAFSATTLGWRILSGILVGFSFYILNELLGELSIVYQLPVAVSAALPIALFALIGWYLNRVLVKR